MLYKLVFQKQNSFKLFTTIPKSILLYSSYKVLTRSKDRNEREKILSILASNCASMVENRGDRPENQAKIAVPPVPLTHSHDRAGMSNLRTGIDPMTGAGIWHWLLEAAMPASFSQEGHIVRVVAGIGM